MTEINATPCVTAAGRPAFVVNVEVFLRRGPAFVLIRRGAKMRNAAGTLAGVGGKVEHGPAGPDPVEATARREVAEEVGVDLGGAPLSYVASGLFHTTDGDPVINVVMTGELPEGAEPHPAAPDEVAEVLLLTAAEAAADPACPEWTVRNLELVESRAG